MRKRFSVLICTYNRHEMLDQALEALVNNTEEKPDQVVVVNGGNEYADHVVLSHQARCPEGVEIRLVNTVNRNLATSRNVGLVHCTGDIVAMTDDDAEVFPDWVTQIKAVHDQHPEAGAVGGPVLGADSQYRFLSRLADRTTFPSPAEMSYVRTLPGVNVSYKRAALDAIGLQDETLFRGEDVDFNWRLQKAGFRVLFHPTIKVWHHHRPTWRKFFQQHHMYGRAYYLVRRKWPDMYCVYPHRIRSSRDILKLGNFFLSIVYEPIMVGVRFTSWRDKFLAAGAVFLNHLSWKSGMFVQAWKEWGISG